MNATPDAEEILTRTSKQLRTLLSGRGLPDPALIGIRTGGLWVAERLAAILNLATPVGELDVSFYRDDFGRAGMKPQVSPSSLPFEVQDRDIVLVDDVLHTGRTVRAALNEIFDYGRPASVLLVTLVDRGGRELPISADIVGLRLPLNPGQQVKLQGPTPLRLAVFGEE
jgi:pyrimidine operon attenuation protein/uracil phosphoribosyltransferase